MCVCTMRDICTTSCPSTTRLASVSTHPRPNLTKSLPAKRAQCLDGVIKREKQ